MKKNRVLFASILIFVFIGLFARNALAQDALELSLGGSPISGNLSSGEEIWYSIQVDEPGALTVILTIETLGTTDTYLEFYDAQRNLISENDDGGEGTNARIEMIGAASGTYLFKLRGFSDEVAGPYRVLVTSDTIPEPAELRFGTVHKGTIAAGTRHWYSVRAEERGFITAETFGNTDTYLEAYDHQYDFVKEDDDGGMKSNALIEMLAEPDQVFIFSLRGYDSETAGDYEIAANFEPIPVDGDPNTERSGAVDITLGEAFGVFFHDSNQSRWYRYEITRDRTNFVVQTRGYVDTFLSLYDQDGNLVAEDDDSGENLNAFINERLNAGVFYIEVRLLSDSIGRCTLHAETR